MPDPKPLHPDDVQTVIQRYQSRIEASGLSFDSMKSGTPERQRIRHYIHSQVIPQNRKASVLDIGSGLGQFLEYMNAQGLDVDYTGYDIVPEYVTFCRENFPAARFEQRNVFEQGIEGQYDVIVLSQVLNNRYQQSDNYQVMAMALELCYKHAKHAVTIDMMSNYVDFQNPDLFYYDPSEILRIAKKIARRVVIRHDYRPFEFSVQLFTPEAEGYVD